jgi:hypothetical protein
MKTSEQLAAATQRVLELERKKQQLTQETLGVERELEKWQQIRDLLKSVSTDKTESPRLVPAKIGLTEAVRVVLGKNPQGISPVEIRDQMIDYGITVKNNENLLRDIHQTLRRFRQRGIVERVGVGGRQIYRLTTQK